MSTHAIDQQAVLSGVAHSVNTPSGCSRLIQTSIEELALLMRKPATRNAVFRETHKLCKEIRQLIQTNGDIETIVEKFRKLSRVKHPFSIYKEVVLPQPSFKEIIEMIQDEQAKTVPYLKERDLLSQVS